MTIEFNDFKRALIEAIEQSIGFDDQTPEYEALLTNIKSLVNDFDGSFIDCIDDVLSVEVPNDKVDNFVSIIEDMTNVYAFDTETFDEDDTTIVTLYIDPDIVMFSDFDEDGYIIPDYSEGDFLTENKFITKFNSKGIKRRKFLCQKGFKYNKTTGACEKITGDEKFNRRLGLRRAVLTKKAGGEALKKRTAIKVRKAKKFRRNSGVK